MLYVGQAVSSNKEGGGLYANLDATYLMSVGWQKPLPSGSRLVAKITGKLPTTPRNFGMSPTIQDWYVCLCVVCVRRWCLSVCLSVCLSLWNPSTHPPNNNNSGNRTTSGTTPSPPFPWRRPAGRRWTPSTTVPSPVSTRARGRTG